MSAIPYAFFDTAKNDIVYSGGMWRCVDNFNCNIITHRHVGSDPEDFIGFTTFIAARISTGLSGNQSVPFVWNYQACYGTDAKGPGMLWTVGSVTQSDTGTPCPTLNSYTKTGEATTDDGGLLLQFGDGYDGQDFEPLRVFVGHMDLKLTLPSSSQGPATASTSGATSSISLTASQNSSQSTLSATRTGSLVSIPAPNVSWTEGPDQTTVVGPSVSSISNTEIASSSNISNTGKIAGIAAGIGAACLLLIAFLLFRSRRRRQQKKQEERINPNEVAPWTPRGVYPPAGWDLVRMEKVKNSRDSRGTSMPPLQFTKSRIPISESSHGESSTQSSTGSQIREIPAQVPLIHAPAPVPGPEISPASVFTSTSPSTILTALPPSYGMHAYHQVVTPHVRMIEESEYSSVDEMSPIDELREWAERHRDIIPIELERRLRAGGFVPGTNPREIPRDIWERRFRVTAYEMRGLQELYDMNPSLSTDL